MREAGGPATEQDVALAREALLDITSAGTVGEPAGSVAGEDGLLTVYFDTTMAGYPGWRWTVTVAHLAGAEPSVLETELTPGEGALLSPDWVPWSERLAEYQDAQAELAALTAVDDVDDDDDDDDDDGFDDLDGIDIDSLDVPESLSAAESGLPAVDHHETEEPEGEADDTGPQPPVKARRQQRAKKQQQPDEGD